MKNRLKVTYRLRGNPKPLVAYGDPTTPRDLERCYVELVSAVRHTFRENESAYIQLGDLFIRVSAIDEIRIEKN